MHEARPYGLFVYGGELSDDDLSFIDHCCKIVTNYKTVSELDSLKYTRDLPDGGFVIVVDAGGSFRAIAYKPKTKTESIEYDGIAKLSIPMLFSAVINDGMARDGKGLELYLSRITAKRLGNYETEMSTQVELQRFRCKYNPIMKAMFIPTAFQVIPEETLLYTQYDKLKASWYSGAMAEVVQIVSGYGRQDIDSLPDDPIEQARMILPASVIDKIQQEIGEQVRLPGYNGVPDEKGSIQYSFTPYPTHLVSFDDQRNPWLVQVDASGVWAMPLPIIPATRTLAFREYIDEMGDHEIKKILDRFGALPSGEGFPTGNDFYRWYRAGVIIKVCDTSDFYKNSVYSTAMGWSSNLDGSNLVNTCYNYVNEYCYGFTYQIGLQLKAAENNGWLAKRFVDDVSPEDQRRISTYISALIQEIYQLSNPIQQASLMYKLRRVPSRDLLDRTSRNGSGDIEYWDNYQCEPITVHEGRCVMTNSGYLFGGLRFKVPEPFLEGCVHVSFAPRAPVEQVPKIDTIVFAYYIGDDLKVVKNFWDERPFSKSTIGNFEDEMIVGNWEQTEYIGTAHLRGEFYSTDFDHRIEIAPMEIKTTLVGTDKGYGQPFARYNFMFWSDGVLTRSRYYTHQQKEWRSSGKSMDIAIVVPFFARNAILYAHTEQVSNQQYRESVKMFEVVDPNSYNYWSLPWTITYNGGLKRTGKPEPIGGHIVWAEEHVYRNHSDAAHDFADEGDWVGGLPANVAKWVNPPNGVTINFYGGDPPKVEEYEYFEALGALKTYTLDVSIQERVQHLHKREHRSEYYTISPDQYGNVLYEDVCKVMFGNMSYANISIKNEAGNRYQFGYSRLANNEHAHTFIGVINE